MTEAYGKCRLSPEPDSCTLQIPTSGFLSQDPIPVHTLSCGAMSCKPAEIRSGVFTVIDSEQQLVKHPLVCSCTSCDDMSLWPWRRSNTSRFINHPLGPGNQRWDLKEEEAWTHLDEEQLGLSHQRLAAIASKKRREILELYGAICTKQHALITMTQQNADKRGAAAVIFLCGWKKPKTKQNKTKRVTRTMYWTVRRRAERISPEVKRRLIWSTVWSLCTFTL